MQGPMNGQFATPTMSGGCTNCAASGGASNFGGEAVNQYSMPGVSAGSLQPTSVLPGTVVPELN